MIYDNVPQHLQDMASKGSWSEDELAAAVHHFRLANMAEEDHDLYSLEDTRQSLGMPKRGFFEKVGQSAASSFDDLITDAGPRVGFGAARAVSDFFKLEDLEQWANDGTLRNLRDPNPSDGFAALLGQAPAETAKIIGAYLPFIGHRGRQAVTGNLDRANAASVSTKAAMAMGGAMISSEYGRYRAEHEVDPIRAAYGAVLMAAAEFVGDKVMVGTLADGRTLGSKKMQDFLKKKMGDAAMQKKGPMARIANLAYVGAMTEGFTEFLQGGIEQGVIDPNATIGDILDAAADPTAVVSGAVLGSLVGASLGSLQQGVAWYLDGNYPEVNGPPTASENDPSNPQETKFELSRPFRATPDEMETVDEIVERQRWNGRRYKQSLVDRTKGAFDHIRDVVGIFPPDSSPVKVREDDQTVFLEDFIKVDRKRPKGGYRGFLARKNRVAEFLGFNPSYFERDPAVQIDRDPREVFQDHLFDVVLGHVKNPSRHMLLLKEFVDELRSRPEDHIEAFNEMAERKSPVYDVDGNQIGEEPDGTLASIQARMGLHKYGKGKGAKHLDEPLPGHRNMPEILIADLVIHREDLAKRFFPNALKVFNRLTSPDLKPEKPESETVESTEQKHDPDLERAKSKILRYQSEAFEDEIQPLRVKGRMASGMPDSGTFAMEDIARAARLRLGREMEIHEGTPTGDYLKSLAGIFWNEASRASLASWVGRRLDNAEGKGFSVMLHDNMLSRIASVVDVDRTTRQTKWTPEGWVVDEDYYTTDEGQHIPSESDDLLPIREIFHNMRDEVRNLKKKGGLEEEAEVEKTRTFWDEPFTRIGAIIRGRDLDVDDPEIDDRAVKAEYYGDWRNAWWRALRDMLIDSLDHRGVDQKLMDRKVEDFDKHRDLARKSIAATLQKAGDTIDTAPYARQLNLYWRRQLLSAVRVGLVSPTELKKFLHWYPTYVAPTIKRSTTEARNNIFDLMGMPNPEDFKENKMVESDFDIINPINNFEQQMFLLKYEIERKAGEVNIVKRMLEVRPEDIDIIEGGPYSKPSPKPKAGKGTAIFSFWDTTYPPENVEELDDMRLHSTHKWVRIKDPLVAKLIASSGRIGAGAFVRGLTQTTQALRGLITSMPDFFVRVTPRDLLESYTMSPTKGHGREIFRLRNFLLNFRMMVNENFRGAVMKMDNKKHRDFVALKAAGAAYSGARDMNVQYGDMFVGFDDMSTLKWDNQNIARSVGSMFRAFLAFASSASRLSENFPRMTAAKAAQDQGKTPYEIAWVAANAGPRFGSPASNVHLRLLMMPLLFFQAALRGTEANFESHFKKPMGATSIEGILGKSELGPHYDRRRKAWAVASATTAVSALVWAWNNSDEEKRERYTNISEFDKHRQLTIMLDDATVRVPLNHEVSFLFMKLPELFLDWVSSREDLQFTETLAVAIQQFFGYNFIPPVISPLYHSLKNEKWTGKPIIMPYMQNTPPRYQYYPHTSEHYKKLSDITNISPLRLEQMIRGYTGYFGELLEATLDDVFWEEDKWGEKPFPDYWRHKFGFEKMLRPRESFVNRWTQKYYELQGRAEGAGVAISNMEKDVNIKGFKPDRRDYVINSGLKELNKFFRSTRPFVGKANKAVIDVTYNPAYSREEKEERIMNIWERLNKHKERVFKAAEATMKRVERELLDMDAEMWNVQSYKEQTKDALASPKEYLGIRKFAIDGVNEHLAFRYGNELGVVK